MRQLISSKGLKILSEHENDHVRCYVCKQRYPVKELQLDIEHQTSIHGTYIYIYEEMITNVRESAEVVKDVS